MKQVVTFAAFVGIAIIASSCAHAVSDSNLCPAGTKVAVLMQKSKITPKIGIEMPPEEGAEGGDIKSWDISTGGNGQPFYWECYPQAEGQSGLTVRNVPKGSTSCTFNAATGANSCSQSE